MSGKKYPCPLAADGMCKHGGNKSYNWGFAYGAASYYRLVKRWVANMDKCPKRTEKPT